MKNAVLLSLLIIMLMGCAQKSYFMSINTMRRAAGVSALPTEDEHREHGAAVLYEDQKTEFRLAADLYRKETYTKAIVYFNENAESWLTPNIYLGSQDNLTSFSARTISPGGNTIELGMKDLHPTELKQEFVEFSDNQSVKFTFSGVESGSVLQYSYSIERYDHFGSFDTWWIQSSIPKLYSRYTIMIPSFFFEDRFAENFTWCYHPKNIHLKKPMKRDMEASTSVRIDESQYKLFTWELKDIEAIKAEPLSPGFSDHVQHVVLGIGARDWDDLSSWYWRGTKHCFVPTTESAKIAREVTLGAKDDRDIIKKVFDYTQKSLRYVAIQVGDSGLIPNHPDEVLERKYGDCKDMTVLNISMLKALGFKAYPALVKTRSMGEPITSIVNLDYNHMVALVYDKQGMMYWLDSTADGCPLSVVHPEIAGATALVIKNDGTHFFKTIPESYAEDNMVRSETRITLGPGGEFKGKTKVVLTGVHGYAFRARYTNETEEALMKHFGGYINDEIKDVLVVNVEHSSFEELDEAFYFTIEYEGRLSGISGSNVMILNPAIIPMGMPLRDFNPDERQNEIVLSSPYRIRDDLWIDWDPKDCQLSSEPVNRKNENDVGRVILTYEHPELGSLHRVAYLDMPHRVIPKSHFSNIAEIIEAVDQQAEERLAFTR
jgi:transglutaminase-like putative cysteine protease